MVSREFLYRLEDQINQARHEIDEKYQMGIDALREALKDVPGWDSTPISYREAGGLRAYTIDGRRITVGRYAPIEEVVAEYLKPTKAIPVATPIDRLKDKFLQARGVAHRVASNMEAEADSLIAAEDAMKEKTASAFAPHKAILAEAGSELKAIEDALNLMSNGGPALDPLPASENTEPAS